MAFRQLKARIRLLLAAAGPGMDAALLDLPPRQAVNPLFSLLHDTDPLLRWRAISAMGLVVAQMAEDRIESARVVMRRLLWNLNDESGGVGWGSPEALGEIMARHAGLAAEYGRLILSFLRPEGNFIEHPLLQRGVLWGLCRLAHAREWHVADAAALLGPFFEAPDPYARGLAAWGTGALKVQSMAGKLTARLGDRGELYLYRQERFETLTVARLAAEALAALGPPHAA